MLSILKTNIKIAFFIGCIFLSLSTAGFAAQDKVLDIHTRIQTQEKMMETFSQKEVEIIERLNKIDYELNKARVKVLALSKEIMLLEGRIEPLSQDRERLSREIALNREYAGERLRALYKMNMFGRLDAAELPLSVFDFFLQQNSMKRIITSDFNILEKQTVDLEKFEILEKALKKEIQAKTALETKLNNQIRMNKKETLKKALILKEIRQKKKLS
ncbi:MAG: hypothetical protein JRC91_03080, partial [Deltaproteobacteria bacterium]|nr:hypothetical protein [Deltaproteobacteria bacterium]